MQGIRAKSKPEASASAQGIMNNKILMMLSAVFIFYFPTVKQCLPVKNCLSLNKAPFKQAHYKTI